MSKFLFIYHAPPMSPDAPEPSAEERASVTAGWMAWAGRVGEDLIDFGNPVAGGVRVTAEGRSPSTRSVNGYSLIEASDFDAALELTRNHPHLGMPGCEIEVHEAMPVPGL